MVQQTQDGHAQGAINQLKEGADDELEEAPEELEDPDEPPHKRTRLEARDVLNEWLAAHRDDPYPSREEKQRLARESGKTLVQVGSWFKYVWQKNGLGRHRHSPVQAATLGASFEKNIFPNEEEKQRLARETGLSFQQVDKWFSGQRYRTGMARQHGALAAPLLAWLHANMKNPFPSLDKRKELAEETERTACQVTKWFDNKRSKINRNRDKKEYEGRCPCCGEVLDPVAPAERSRELGEVDEPDINPGEPDEPQDLMDKSVKLGELGQQDESVDELIEVHQQDESEDSDFDLDELEGVPEKLEAPPRLEAGHPIVRPRSANFSTQQKDIMRAWLCENLGTRRVPQEMLEPVARAAGLTAQQVRGWIKAFYCLNPTPTLEQAMAWRKSSSSYEPVLNEWLAAHRDDPHPGEEEKQRLAREVGKNLKQIDTWFYNARLNNGPPRVRLRHFNSPVQVATLSASFEENIYPNEEEKQRLAGETGRTLAQIGRDRENFGADRFVVQQSSANDGPGAP